MKKYMRDAAKIIPIHLKVASGQSMETKRQRTLVVCCNQGMDKLPKQISIESEICRWIPI